jgi:hypothetical protein
MQAETLWRLECGQSSQTFVRPVDNETSNADREQGRKRKARKGFDLEGQQLRARATIGQTHKNYDTHQMTSFRNTDIKPAALKTSRRSLRTD